LGFGVWSLRFGVERVEGRREGRSENYLLQEELVPGARLHVPCHPAWARRFRAGQTSQDSLHRAGWKNEQLVGNAPPHSHELLIKATTVISMRISVRSNERPVVCTTMPSGWVPGSTVEGRCDIGTLPKPLPLSAHTSQPPHLEHSAASGLSAVDSSDAPPAGPGGGPDQAKKRTAKTWPGF
jgi:hypothetical protein